ncbi:MAG: FeoB-associated Cys-rich membrane protein [Ruminococcaceae bacterium]|nr:FeoB-associated Cys-rich membrane protein [Oscillospiraceae bacterium]
MSITDWIAVFVILLIIGGATAYIIKAKKSGKKCIGCPDSCSCSSQKGSNGNSGCNGCCHCNEHKDS